MFRKNQGNVLKYKSGYNPNSSSIGTNLTPLLIGGAVISLLIPVVSIVVSRRIQKKNKASLETDHVKQDESPLDKESDQVQD